MKSPQQRTIDVLEAEGYLVDIVERRVTSRIKKDLFGFIDLLALAPDGGGAWAWGVLGVQVTSGPNHAARRKKILNDCNENAKRWLMRSNKIQVRSWSKRVVKRGKAKRVWVERVQDIILEDLKA